MRARKEVIERQRKAYKKASKKGRGGELIAAFECDPFTAPLDNTRLNEYAVTVIIRFVLREVTI